MPGDPQGWNVYESLRKQINLYFDKNPVVRARYRGCADALKIMNAVSMIEKIICVFITYDFMY